MTKSLIVAPQKAGQQKKRGLLNRADYLFQVIMAPPSQEYTGFPWNRINLERCSVRM